MVGAAQLGPGASDRQENLSAMLRLLVEAVERGVQILSFPELALTKYFPRFPPPADVATRHRYFDTLEDAPASKVLALAREARVALIVPYAERAGGKYFNSALVVSGTGERLGKYRKVHLPEPVEWVPGEDNAFETSWFTPGNLGFPVFDVGVARVGVIICYDRHFPEAARCLAVSGAEIIFLCTNSPTYSPELRPWRAEMHDMIIKMRAYENTTFVVAASKAGTEDGMEWLGRSAIVSPDGQILAMSKQQDGSELVWAAIDLDDIGAARTTRRFIAERRPDQYKKMVM
ncbi:MAG TPA: carbon-nitrogen hydrolase family protein [bacterium]